jgi:hypothetical protein
VSQASAKPVSANRCGAPVMRKASLKMAVAVGAGLYFLWCAWDPKQWHLIDGANLLIHEAGHILFMPFGEFMMIAGGSIFQVLMPLIFVGYFVYSSRAYSAALTLYWVGQSMLNVSVYAGDASAMELPLIGGQDSVHDWNYLLEHLGLLMSTRTIAGSIRFAGTAVIIAGLCWAIVVCRKEGREQSSSDPGVLL